VSQFEGLAMMGSHISPQERARLQGLREKMLLGLDAEAFMQTRLGGYLAERVEAMEAAAKDHLAEVDPEDTKAIRALQNDIKVASLFKQWICDAFNEGQHANAELQAYGAE
jgi:hypothetical protein